MASRKGKNNKYKERRQKRQAAMRKEKSPTPEELAKRAEQRAERKARVRALHIDLSGTQIGGCRVVETW